MTYWYYISYSFQNLEGETGFEGATITRTRSISSDEDVTEITQSIKSNRRYLSVVIIAWNLLREE